MVLLTSFPAFSTTVAYFVPKHILNGYKLKNWDFKMTVYKKLPLISLHQCILKFWLQTTARMSFVLLLHILNIYVIFFVIFQLYFLESTYSSNLLKQLGAANYVFYKQHQERFFVGFYQLLKNVHIWEMATNVFCLSRCW